MKYFTRDELACNCMCGKDTVDYKLAELLDAIREHFGVPVTVTSGNRCPNYNAQVGGGVNSQHLLGKAADIQVEGIAPRDVGDVVADLMKEFDIEGGLSVYNSFTHVDVRDHKARW